MKLMCLPLLLSMIICSIFVQALVLQCNNPLTVQETGLICNDDEDALKSYDCWVQVQHQNNGNNNHGNNCPDPINGAILAPVMAAEVNAAVFLEQKQTPCFMGKNENYNHNGGKNKNRYNLFALDRVCCHYQLNCVAWETKFKKKGPAKLGLNANQQQKVANMANKLRLVFNGFHNAIGAHAHANNYGDVQDSSLFKGIHYKYVQMFLFLMII